PRAPTLSPARPLAGSDGLCDAVDAAQLGLQVSDVRPGVHRPADDPLEHLAREELAAVAVQVVPEPVAERAELGPLDLVVEIRNRLAHFLPDLHRDAVAEGVGRVVVEPGAAPVQRLPTAA